MWNKISTFLKELSTILPVLVTLASIVTAVIPNPSNEEQVILIFVHRTLDVIALNVGNNIPSK